jgi:hypothetical protein
MNRKGDWKWRNEGHAHGTCVSERQWLGIGECLREKSSVWMFKPARIVAVASPVPGIAA